MMVLLIEFAFAPSREGVAPREASFIAKAGLAIMNTPLADEYLLSK
jgi:hypothetical protein